MEASPSPANAPIPAFVPTFSSRIPDPPPEAEVFTSFKSLPPRPQGDYYVKIAAGRTNKYYVTHDRLGRMYVRLMRKEAQTYTPEVLGVTAEVLGGMDIKGIAFSDKLITVETEYSWILPTVKVSYKWATGTAGCYYYPEHECPNNALLNFINGKTPTGTEWSQDYDKGHLNQDARRFNALMSRIRIHIENAFAGLSNTFTFLSFLRRRVWWFRWLWKYA